MSFSVYIIAESNSSPFETYDGITKSFLLNSTVLEFTSEIYSYLSLSSSYIFLASLSSFVIIDTFKFCLNSDSISLVNNSNKLFFSSLNSYSQTLLIMHK